MSILDLRIKFEDHTFNVERPGDDNAKKTQIPAITYRRGRERERKSVHVPSRINEILETGTQHDWIDEM